MEHFTGDDNLVALKKNRLIELSYGRFFSKIRKLSKSRQPLKDTKSNSYYFLTCIQLTNGEEVLLKEN